VADTFPALVTLYPADVVSGFESPFDTVGFSDLGGTKFSDCRVIVHKNRLIVGADSPRGVQKIFDVAVSEVFVSRPFTRVLTVAGELFVFSLSKGCGCGSKLRSWNPYGNMMGSSRD
jgi:hypothetical protein